MLGINMTVGKKYQITILCILILALLGPATSSMILENNTGQYSTADEILSRIVETASYDRYLELDGIQLSTLSDSRPYYDEYGVAVQQTVDGGYLVAGLQGVYDGIEFNASFLFIKTDNNGDILWNTTLPVPDHLQLIDIIPTHDGGFILFSSTMQSYNLIKINNQGEEVWNNTLPEFPYSGFIDIEETHDHGFILGGVELIEFDEYTYDFEIDFLLVKLNATGNFLWNATYDHDELDQIFKVIETDDHGYAFIGFSSDMSSFMGDLALLKVDEQGTEQWRKIFTDTNYNTDIFIGETEDKGIILGGGKTIFHGDYPQQIIALLKTDEYGDIQWEKEIEKANTDLYIMGLLQLENNGLVLTGHQKNADLSLENPYPENQLFLIKTNDTGEQQWFHTYDIDHWEVPMNIAETTDHGYILTGYYNTMKNYHVDLLLLKTDNDGDTEWFTSYGRRWHDTIKPQIELVQPEPGLYIRGEFRKELTIPVVFGDILLHANASDNGTWVEYVEFYVDGELLQNDSDEPYSVVWEHQRMYFRFLAHRHVIRVVAYDAEGNKGSLETTVWRFF